MSDWIVKGKQINFMMCKQIVFKDLLILLQQQLVFTKRHQKEMYSFCLGLSFWPLHTTAWLNSKFFWLWNEGSLETAAAAPFIMLCFLFELWCKLSRELRAFNGSLTVFMGHSKSLKHYHLRDELNTSPPIKGLRSPIQDTTYMCISLMQFLYYSSSISYLSKSEISKPTIVVLKSWRIFKGSFQDLLKRS